MRIKIASLGVFYLLESFTLIVPQQCSGMYTCMYLCVCFNRKNVSYSSTCNIVGVIFGIFVASVGFVLLVSEDFNNKYFRTTPGTGGLTTIKSIEIKTNLFACRARKFVDVYKCTMSSYPWEGVNTAIIIDVKLLKGTAHNIKQ